MSTTRVNTSTGSYEIFCASGAIARSASLIAKLDKNARVFVVSSPKVWQAWGKRISSELGAGRGKECILFDDAESAKRMSSVEEICRALVRAGADRRSTVVAVGGGVVGDVVGYAAASYLRGVRLVHIPTTLVSMIDSSIGGKTGVDLPEGKNLVGAFYPPALIITDPSLLSTLPHREFRSGLFEVVKTGVIADAALFQILERRMTAILGMEPEPLAKVIDLCIRVKAYVVEEDEREGGLRQILNYGHTIGHALETATNYKRFLHGEAIGWGMIAATLMAVATERLADADALRIIRMIADVGPLPPLGKITAEQLRPIMAGDKKARGGRVLWVLPRKIGKTEWGVDVPWPIVAKTFAQLPEIAAKARI